ncbi:MAG: SH3 domain-containing protein [Christensenellales bacterium]|jgi:cell wall-associated NlpC family hydrolase
MKKKLLATLLLLLFLAETAFAASTAILKKQAKLYSKASTKSSVVHTLNKGAVLTLLSSKGRIAKVQYEGKTLYMARSALIKVKKRTTLQESALYQSASASSKRLKAIPPDSTVYLFAKSKSWYKAQYDGVQGYLPASALKAPNATPTPAPAPVKMTVLRTSKVYAAKSTSSKVVGTVKSGTVVGVYEIAGKFAKIRRSGKFRYIPLSAFTADSVPTPTPTPTPMPTPSASPYVRAVEKKTRVYKSASTSSKVIGTLKAGATVTVLDERGDWCKVKKGSSTGYVLSSAFEAEVPPDPTPTPTPEPTPTPGPRDEDKVETVVAAAMDKLGLPYVYGSTGPNSYDCSGLTRYAYSKVGISLAHSAYSQGYNAPVRLTMDQLQRGDLVFFNTNKYDGDLCDHVGIYLGKGQFIHASSGKGRVIVSTLTTGYYAGVFSWGRKVL